MNVIAFAASNSEHSINGKLINYVCSLLPDDKIEQISINDYAMPVYSIDHEEREGIPEEARAFLDKLASADALIISFAEHNGLYTAAYKSLFDWASRVDRFVYQNKPMILLATSPGGRGGSGVLGIAAAAAPRFGGEVLATVSVPSFFDHFDVERNALTSDEHIAQINNALGLLPRD